MIRLKSLLLEIETSVAAGIYNRYEMLSLGLIDIDDAKEMESLTPNGREVLCR